MFASPRTWVKNEKGEAFPMFYCLFPTNLNEVTADRSKAGCPMFAIPRTWVKNEKGEAFPMYFSLSLTNLNEVTADRSKVGCPMFAIPRTWVKNKKGEAFPMVLFLSVTIPNKNNPVSLKGLSNRKIKTSEGLRPNKPPMYAESRTWGTRLYSLLRLPSRSTTANRSRASPKQTTHVRGIANMGHPILLFTLSTTPRIYNKSRKPLPLRQSQNKFLALTFIGYIA